MEHTEGKSRVSTSDGIVIVTTSPVGVLVSSDRICDCTNSSKPISEVMANANLFANAPQTLKQRDDLLGLCKITLPFITHLAARDNVDSVCILRTELIAMIKKVSGI